VTEQPRIRLVVVDDNPAMLRQIAQVLPNEFEIAAMCQNGDELQDALAACDPDVVVLDITLPGENGIIIASRLTRAACRARIVFLSVHHDADYVRSTMAAGAVGYVVKMRLSLDLPAALLAAHAGERFVSPLPELRIE
jgi:DNA-binding NarL/FixJ family response regulator